MNDMDDVGGEDRGHTGAPRSGEGTLADLAQMIVENPWMNQALHLAFGARERASQAGAAAIRNLNLPTSSDVDRLARRMRAISERLEEVEDTLDRISGELAALQRERESAARPEASSQG